MMTVGNTFMEHFYLPYDEDFAEIQNKMQQHKFVLSDRLVAYYKQCAKGKGQAMEDACRLYIDKLIMCKNKSEFVDDFDASSIQEEMLRIAWTQPMKILLAEKNEIEKVRKGINLLTCNDIRTNDNCVFNLYSIPVINRFVKPHENVEKYVKWLGNWLKGEKRIAIRDKYLLTENGIPSFEKFYLPLFEKGAVVSIYTDEDVSEKYLDELDKDIYADYVIRVYKCTKMHERVIVLDNFQIVIGKGLDFLHANFENTSESFITISKVTINVNDTVIAQIK